MRKGSCFPRLYIAPCSHRCLKRALASEHARSWAAYEAGSWPQSIRFTAEISYLLPSVLMEAGGEGGIEAILDMLSSQLLLTYPLKDHSSDVLALLPLPKYNPLSQITISDGQSPVPENPLRSRASLPLNCCQNDSS